MLTPLQSAQTTAALSAMQSIVETIEDRRREDAEKASGRKPDEVLQQAHLRSDNTARQANARINEHFFGSNGRDEDTLAKLISRFSNMLDVTQQEGETSRAFAQRLSDMLTLVDAIGLPAKGSELNVTLGSLGTTLSAVKQAMSGPSDDASANLVARLALTTGVVQGESEADADFGQRLSSMLTGLRGELPTTVEALEKKSGLSELGLRAADLVAAIRNPYGMEAQRVKEALAEKASDEKALTPEMRKVIARLEDTANPKTIEELKLERTERDPTRVEDAETRAEREDAIRSLEAGEKLEDMRDLQDAVGRATDAESVRDKEEQEEAKKDIFALRVDDNGIYDLITRQIVA